MPKPFALRSLTLAIACLAAQVAAAGEPEAADAEFFEREVRPVLATKCQKCHGEGANSKGGLKLISRESVLEGGESGPAAIAGKPEESPMIEAVKYEGLEMPPDAKLTDREIASLTHWIKRGLPWPAKVSPAPKPLVVPKHWAFQPVAQPRVPNVANAAWAQTDVDRFILAGLESRGLAPSLPVDKARFLRRATFDLTGLPPTPQEIDAFLNDHSPVAMATVVDRLLASPHYGERQARMWLDVARYADTKGYFVFESANYPWAYTYRDYVIDAFNRDLPYDQFVKEQLAADQLESGGDRRPLAAMGFLTVGSRFMNNDNDVTDDRVDCITRGLLGLTVTCARCHDHKYDPIPTRDYYSLYGVLANSMEPFTLPILQPPPESLATKFYFYELARRERALNAFIAEKRSTLVQSSRARTREYLLAAHGLRDKPSTESFMEVSQADDLNPVMIVRWRLFIERTGRDRHPVMAAWNELAGAPVADFAARLARFLDAAAKPQAGQPPINRLLFERLRSSAPKNVEDLATCYGKLLTEVDQRWQERLASAAIAEQPDPTALADPQEEELRQVFYAPGAPTNVRLSGDGDLLLYPDRVSQERRTTLIKAVQTWRAEGPGAPARAMVLVDRPEVVPACVFVRGNPMRPGDVVPRQFLEVLAGPNRKPFAHGSGRLDLANAIVDRSNPLTARVMVNRIWLHHFGTGLVRTPSDFGLRSDPPSHPELLDYLASTFMDEGWSIKRMHRLIMLSAVYQQQSEDRPDARQKDPENRLLWRMNRQRLDWEANRDAMLAVAGRLDATIGGPPVKEITAADSTRRTMYGFLDRLNVPGILRTFDFPSPDATSPQRYLTTVPQQALFMMNGPLIHACANGLLARQEIAVESDLERRMGQMYRLCFGRLPSDAERAAAREFLGAAPTSTLWGQYAHALMMSNEFVFID